MSPEEFAARLAAVPEVEPDETDLAMLEEAEQINDGTAVPLEAFNQELESATERLELRLSRGLLRLVKESADREGVSLNDYVLRKLAL